MDVGQLLEELRATVEHARAMPMSSSVVVSRTDVLARIDALESALPEAFADSNRVMTDRDSVLAQARRDAERVAEEATQERDRLVSDSEVYRVAKRESEALRAQVRQECASLRQETDEYVDGRLANLEVSLTKTLEAVSRGRGRLQGRSELDRLGDEDSVAAFSFPS